MNNALDKAIQKIYENVSETGVITDNQLIFLIIYEKRKKNNSLDSLLKDGTKIISVIDGILGGK